MTATATATTEQPETRRAAVTLAALGVVFGDIGTSPLYALRACFLGANPVAPTTANVLGLLSLIAWALIIVVTLKYLIFLMRADNHGEGGILALLALLRPWHETSHPQRRLLVLLGIGGAALLYGDGVITPAISVLSAVEGLELAAPMLRPAVLPVTVLILLLLFLAQARGTARIATLFGPVMLAWFLVLAALGVGGIALRPEVLMALSPHYAARFVVEQGGVALLVLGAVFLVVTGGEALYADMGQLGRRPIRLAWFAVVLPALLLNYFGQGALLLHAPRETTEPFYHLAPTWALVPLVLLATIATVIASQAVITGAFSLTRQAIQLGLCPRLRVTQTSAVAVGQVYLPAVSVLLLAGAVALVLGFRSSDRLASAYGLAVSGTILITTLLAYAMARHRAGWSRRRAGLLAGGFLIVDLAFFAANGLKIADGGWVSVLIGGGIFTVLTTWHRGCELLMARRRGTRPLEAWLAELGTAHSQRIHGTAVFLTSHRSTVPPVLLHHLRHNQVLHQQVVLLTVVTENRPRVPLTERTTLEKLDLGFFQISVHYGFMETPNVPAALAACAPLGIAADPARITYYIGRRTVIATDNEIGMALWRKRLFAYLSRNALPATAFFRLPSDQVVELGDQVTL